MNFKVIQIYSNFTSEFQNDSTSPYMVNHDQDNQNRTKHFIISSVPDKPLLCEDMLLV